MSIAAMPLPKWWMVILWPGPGGLALTPLSQTDTWTIKLGLFCGYIAMTWFSVLYLKYNSFENWLRSVLDHNKLYCRKFCLKGPLWTRFSQTVNKHFLMGKVAPPSPPTGRTETRKLVAENGAFCPITQFCPNILHKEIYRQYIVTGCTRSVSLGSCILKRFPTLTLRNFFFADGILMEIMVNIGWNWCKLDEHHHNQNLDQSNSQ